MNEVAPARAVRSSAYGMDQHSMFSWEIDGDDFVYEEGVSAGAKGTHEVLGTWLASFSDEELPGVVDALFSAMAVSGAQNAGQIFGGGPQAAQYIHEAIRKSDERTREVWGPGWQSSPRSRRSASPAARWRVSRKGSRACLIASARKQALAVEDFYGPAAEGDQAFALEVLEHARLPPRGRCPGGERFHRA